MHVHVVCPHCLGTNRVPAVRIDQAPNCGRCHEPLFRGRAEAFDAAGFERLIANTELPILVDFWAPWCGPCRTMGPNVDAAARSLEPRVRVAKVDVEANPTLGQRFRVQSIPTLTLISGGRELARSSGVMSPQQIVAWVVPQLVQGAE
jgi:thioredoxin 2